MTLGRQFQQLQMLMKPSEVAAMPGFEFGDQFHTGDPEVDVDMLRQQKLQEAGTPEYRGLNQEPGPSLARQIRNEGVKEPISIRHAPRDMVVGRKEPKTILANGHHRYFVTERWEGKGEEVYLPVSHY